jgi:THO complex subunit 2
LTDECRASWNSTGKKAIIDAGTRAVTEDDPIILSTVFQEIVRAVLDGRLDPTDGGHTVRDILQAPNANEWLDPQSLFLDSLSIIMEMETPQPSLRVFVSATNIDPAKLRLELESPLLESLGLVRSTFYKMSIRKATSALYRMSAYNLLREESEGYSKLLTEYFTTVQDRGSEGPRSAVVAETWGRVKALIGAFDLDVGRVLDVTLDVAANMLIKRGDFFVKFFRISTWWPRERVIENLEWEHQGFTSLPRWAEPGVDRWTLTEEEKAQLSALREIRDQNFWQRVKQVGMDAFFEIGGRRITNGDRLAVTNGAALGEDQSEPGTKGTDPHDDAKWTAQWIKATGTLPPQGNRIAAQLLGFKLRFYASDSRDASDVLPDNLIALTALLIKIGFISLVDLYPHLYPPDEDMPVLKEKLMKEKEEREKKARPGGSMMNALAMAGALSDDTLPAPVSRLRVEESRASSVKPDEKAGTPARADEEKDQLPEPVNQKYELLKSLLCMGCIPEALFVLGRFPWLMDGYPDLPQHVNRILHLSIKNIYDPVRPLADENLLHELQADVTEASAVSKGPLKFLEGVPRRNMRWTKIEAVDSDGTGVDYRYFWETWSDNIPMCQTVDDVFLLCDTLLNLCGVKIGHDPKLLVKLARIGRHSIKNDSSDANVTRWIELSKRLLVPALSLTKGNLGAVNEMWELLKLFPTKVRYNIYAEWYTGQTSRLPDVKVAFDLTRAQTKDVLKRISKTNVRLMARNLAKVTLSSPGVVFSVTLNQIESYDNLIQTVIECTKYFTYLAYDVLHWALLSALGGGGRSRMQEDGMLTSSWLRALSQYTGGIFKQYKVMTPTPILQYVTDQLRRGNSTDLEIL